MALPWYKEGLRFSCTGCGKCCQGKPGYVFLTINEMETITNTLNIPFETFTKTYVRQVGDRYSLIEIGDNYACVFLKENVCSIYEVRPKQCKTFPFWPKHLASEENWNSLKSCCEGIHDDAPLIPLDEIRRQSTL